MAIVRLALANPAANTNTLLHTATRQSLVSVIATNTAATNATIRIWVQPHGSSSPSQYAYQAYDTALPANNSMETFRFALESEDVIYVRASTANVSFSLNAIHESSGNQNIVTVTTTEPVGPDIGDVWVNPNTLIVAFWDGAAWVSAVGGSAGFPQPTEPAFPNQGAIWVDIDSASPGYPEYPTVIYSPTQPTGLSMLDVGTIWVDEDTSYITVYDRWRSTATAGQTVITGSGEDGIILSYTPGYEQVFINGILITRIEDYTANNGTSIVLMEALSEGDSIQIITLDSVEITDTYTQSQVDSLISASVTAVSESIISPFLLSGM